MEGEAVLPDVARWDEEGSDVIAAADNLRRLVPPS